MVILPLIFFIENFMRQFVSLFMAGKMKKKKKIMTDCSQIAKGIEICQSGVLKIGKLLMQF